MRLVSKERACAAPYAYRIATGERAWVWYNGNRRSAEGDEGYGTSTLPEG